MSRALISRRFTQSLFYVAHSNRLNLSFSVFFIEIASVFGSKVMGKRSTDKKILENFFRDFRPKHHIWGRNEIRRNIASALKKLASLGAKEGFRGGA